jgi:transposase InsO family protein
MKPMALTRIDEAVGAGVRQHEACDVLGITDRTLRRWRRSSHFADKRKGAPRACPHALSDDEKAAIVDTCNQPAYQSLPPSQIVPRLADEGRYLASESSFYRVLKQNDQCHRRGRSQTPREVSKPKALAAAMPNQVWSWDITYLPTAVRGQFYRLYLVMDVYSRFITGWEVHGEELASLEEARQWVHAFVTWYNTQHRHSAIRFVTPQERHEGQDSAILKARTTTYEAAKAAHPDRWRTRPVRNWTPIGTVWLAQP